MGPGIIPEVILDGAWLAFECKRRLRSAAVSLCHRQLTVGGQLLASDDAESQASLLAWRLAAETAALRSNALN